MSHPGDIEVSVQAAWETAAGPVAARLVSRVPDAGRVCRVRVRDQSPDTGRV